MQVYPDIAALRDDSVRQRRTVAAMQRHLSAWRSKRDVNRLMSELKKYGDGAELGQCECLVGLVQDRAIARSFIEDWIASLIASARTEPFLEPQFAHHASNASTSMRLMRAGGTCLDIVAFESGGSDTRRHGAVTFIDSESHDLVLRGSLKGRWCRLQRTGGEQTLEVSHMEIAEGAILISNTETTWQPIGANGSALVLRLSRQPALPSPTRTYSIEDGTLLRIADGGKAASERLMAVSILGAIGDDCALERLRHVAADRKEEPHIRWEAIRQTLALDARSGEALLIELDRDDDPLSHPARSFLRTFQRGYATCP